MNQLIIIGDLLINEYSQDEYHLRITTFRHTGELASIVVDSQFMGENNSQVYYGSKAKDVLKVLTGFKLGQALGLTDKLDLSGYNFQGSNVFMSKESH